MSGERVEVRSYRTVFELERRLYRVDRFRLNPAGVPLRGVAYFALALVAVALAQTIPLAGWPLRELPWYLRYIGLPLGWAALLTVVRVDGRPVHLVLGALWRGPGAARRLNALRPCPSADSVWRPPPVLFIPDGSDAWLRRYRFQGPGAVLVRVAHDPPVARRARGRANEIALRASTGPPPSSARVISLRAGATLAIDPRPSRPRGSPRARGVSTAGRHR